MSYIHNIYLYQYHDTKSNPINIDWLLGLTPTVKLGIYILIKYVGIYIRKIDNATCWRVLEQIEVEKW
jgi:hypothetical protein